MSGPKVINEENQGEQQQKSQGEAQLARDDLRFVLSSPQGRRFLYRMIEGCGFFITTADNSGSWTYFNEGKRNVALSLVNDIKSVHPDSFLTVMKEGMKNG